MSLKLPEPPQEVVDDAMAELSLGTRAVHADDPINTYTDVAPAMHVSTTFRYSSDPEQLHPADDEDLTGTEPPVYSRLSAPNTTRLELILSSLCHGHALTYTSGLAAFHALLVFLKPRVIAISDGYHGCHGVIGLLTRLYGLKKVSLAGGEEEWDAAGLGEGDVVHVETPINPSGECVDLRRYVEMARRRGAAVTCDATFGPPGLQDPFACGVDVVMHSGTKYFGGHSDMLCGVLVVKREEWWRGLYTDRIFLGSVMGSMEGWLGVRSVRTLEVRMERQSANAERLVGWLETARSSSGQQQQNQEGLDQGGEKVDAGPVKALVTRLQHASLQAREPGNEWVQEQMPGGFGPVFVMWMSTREAAKRLPSKLKLFHHATSLGGVESLIEWRRMSDSTVDDRVMRLSIGVEDWRDLRADLVQGMVAVAKDLNINIA